MGTSGFVGGSNMDFVKTLKGTIYLVKQIVLECLTTINLKL